MTVTTSSSPLRARRSRQFSIARAWDPRIGTSSRSRAPGSSDGCAGPSTSAGSWATGSRCEPCPACSGRGTLKTAETVTYEIFREITRAVRQFNTEKLLVMASPNVVGRILEEESAAVAELEEFISKSIRFQAEEHYSQEQFDVVLL